MKEYLSATDASAPATEVNSARFLKMHEYGPWRHADAGGVNNVSCFLLAFVLMVSRESEAVAFSI
jgi:hypothetical protein